VPFCLNLQTTVCITLITNLEQNMKISVSTKDPAAYTGDMIILFVRQPAKGQPVCPVPGLAKAMAQACLSGDFQGREGQTLLFYPIGGKGRPLGTRRALVIGLGKDEVKRETLRQAGGSACCATMKTKATKLLAVLPEDVGLAVLVVAESLAEGLILGAYQFHKYQKFTDPDETPGAISEITLFSSRATEARRGLARGRVAAEAAWVARDMANEPANYWTPAHFARFGRDLAKSDGLKCTVLGKPEMIKLGLNGLLAINQGSSVPPTMTVLEYRCGTKKAPTLLLVGKGLTFDSGGISLKPGVGMEEMKYDMCGGAAVMAVMQALGRERPRGVNVVGIVPSTENLPGPAALKPGVVVTLYNGKTVEVVNTDAEGRMILADALAYGVATFKPDAVVDIATLTGAVIVALGHHRTGLLANDDALAARVLTAADEAGEPAWRLPLGPEYRKQLKSQVADLKNVDKRDAGTILGAVFLQEFVAETPWVHLDIAGTAWNYTEKSYIPKGPSAVGVRTLLALVRSY